MKKEIEIGMLYNFGQHRAKFLTATVSVAPTISECIDCGLLIYQFDGHIHFYPSKEEYTSDKDPYRSEKKIKSGCKHLEENGKWKCEGWNREIPDCKKDD